MGMIGLLTYLRSRCDCGAKAIDPSQDFPLYEVPRGTVERFRRDMNKVFGEMSDRLIDRLEDSGLAGQELIDAAVTVMRQEDWGKLIGDAARPVIERMAEWGGRSGADEIGTVFDVAHPQMEEWVDTATTRLSEDIRLGTETRVVDLIRDEQGQGGSIQQITQRLRDQGFDRVRAERIARTESARAYTQGNIEAWRQSGLVGKKRWVVSPDACEFCRAAGELYAKSGVGLDQSFFPLGSTLRGVEGGTYNFDYSEIQGPPLHPGCRCALLPVLSED